MAIVVTLLFIVAFILFAVGAVMFIRWAFKKIDKLEVEETKSDIKHKAELTKDVDTFKQFNKTEIEKAKSDSVEEFKDILEKD